MLGWSRQISTIDSKQLNVSHGGPTAPTWQESFPGQGMPISKNPTERGNLIVKVNVCGVFIPLFPEDPAANSHLISDIGCVPYVIDTRTKKPVQKNSALVCIICGIYFYLFSSGFFFSLFTFFFFFLPHPLQGLRVRRMRGVFAVFT